MRQSFRLTQMNVILGNFKEFSVIFRMFFQANFSDLENEENY